MPLPLRFTIGRILALALVASLFVSPIAAAPPARAAVPAPGNVQTDVPLQDITSIAAGASHNCAVTNEGSLKCWGYSEFLQLGTPTPGFQQSRWLPAEIAGLSGKIAQVVAGFSHTCVLTTSGGVKCWGSNYAAQLGNGTTTASPTPVDVVGLGSGVKALIAGGGHTCALTDAGGVKCWGVNNLEQLGDGTTTDRTTPVDVVGLESGVKALAAAGGAFYYFFMGGASHTCALTDQGKVKCWGANGYGQLGNGVVSEHSAPVEVPGLNDVSSLAVGGIHTCALTHAGSVKCWGGNTSGQLGDGTTQTRLTPVDVVGLGHGVKAVGAGMPHSCAVMTSGTVKCWGWNSSGELGDGTTTKRPTPVDVIGLSGVTAVGLGEHHTCALTAAGRVKCWGDNSLSQLGVSWNNPIPADVRGLENGVVTMAVGGAQTCAVTSIGSLKCWGANDAGQLGDGTTMYRDAPVDVFGLGSGVAAVSAGIFHTCAVTRDGAAKCWGQNNSCQLGDGTQGTNRTKPVNVSGLTNGISGIAAAYTHTCAVVNGGAKCWGSPVFGQLGDGTPALRKTPMDVVGLSGGVRAISAGGGHSCALTDTGGVKCWGQGPVGDGTATNRTSPADVIGLTGSVKAIAVGATRCALTDMGGVKCWGETPVNIVGLETGVTALAASDTHVCALTSAGGVKCWGNNRYGQLGDGTTSDRETPVDVIGLESGVTAIAAGLDRTCAVVGDGRPKCWGIDTAHMAYLDTGGYWPQSMTPVDVIGSRAPVVNTSYASGKPGSFFTLTGMGFPANTPITITVNGAALSTTAATTLEGSFILFLDMTGANAGFYEVAVTAGGTASTVLALHPDAPLRVQEGGGTTLVVPAGIGVPANTLFLPRMRH